MLNTFYAHANLREYTTEARPRPGNFTANKRQAVCAAPELVSAAGEPIFAILGSFIASPRRRLPKPLFGSQEPIFEPFTGTIKSEENSLKCFS